MPTSTLPPWGQLSFVFDLGANKTDTYILPQCSNATWEYWDQIDGQTVNPPPTPPYHAVMYAGGYEPFIIPLNNTASAGKTNWTANLPVGPRFGVSLMDARNYSGGILEAPLVMTSRAGCNVANPLKPSSLDVEVITGNGQCQEAILKVKNGTAPYKLEVAPMNIQQKTIYYASSPFSVTLDISAGVEYYLAVYDSVGNSATMGSYTILASSDNSCLGEAATVTAGQYSTLYSGGTAMPTSSTAPSSSGSRGLGTPAIIGIAVGVPIGAIILTALLLWFCYKQNHRKREAEDKPEIEPGVSYPHTGYTPVPTTTQYTGSYHDVSSTGHYNPQIPAPIPYPLPPTMSDRHTIHTLGDGSTSEPSSTGFSEKRRHLVNPDAHDLGPIDAEPFDPNSVSGTSRPRTGLPPLPPAYSASS